MEFRHELVMPNEHLPFRMFIFEGKDGNYKVSKHWHRSLELFLVLDGSITFYVNSQPYLISGKDFIIANPNEIHAIDSPQSNKTIVVQIPLQAFDGYIQEDQFIKFKKQDEKQNADLIKRIQRMYEAYQAKEDGYLLFVKSCFYEVLFLLYKDFKDEGMNEEELNQKKQLHRLSRITGYMKEHYQEDITLPQVADIFGFTPTYLSRVFHKYAQVSYQTYLIDLRVSHAIREMMNTNHSISEIAMAHGFPDSRSFSKAFRKRYGCVPSEYRKRKGS